MNNTISPLVSVIIPNYNHALYLDQRIQSVLNQTYPKFEVIILDDKSTDNSIEVIEKYKSHPKVSQVIINEDNSGSTFIQWNKGFEIAKGSLIWIAESDDYCEPEFLSKCVEEFRKDTATSVVYTSSVYVDAQNNKLPTYNPFTQKKYHYYGTDFIKYRMDYGSAIWNASSAVFRKDFALSIKCDYQAYKACGDRLFWIYMAELGNVVYLNSDLNYFRQHDNKVSPRKFRDGTSLKEENQIYKSLKKKGYIRGVKRGHILNLYYKKILNGDFESEDIRRNLLSIWGMNNMIKVGMISILSRLYQYSLHFINTSK